MQLTYNQCEYISKQYRRYLDGKITLDKCSENLQKHFNVSYDFRPVITECKEMNKGAYDIGWALADF